MSRDFDFYSACHVSNPFDPTNTLQTSYVLSPGLLNSLRLFFAAYMFSAEIAILIVDAMTHNGGTASHWSYFTNITYWSFAFYFLFAAFHGLLYSRSGHAPLQRWPKSLQFCHKLLYATVTTYPFLVTVVYWAILASSETLAAPYNRWSNASVHALNSVLAIFEIVFARTEPHPWIFLPFIILFLALYLALAYVTHATEGFYTYDFLDPSNGSGRLVGYVFGILIAIIILFTLSKYAIWTRTWLFERKLEMNGKLKEGQVERISTKNESE